MSEAVRLISELWLAGALESVALHNLVSLLGFQLPGMWLPPGHLESHLAYSQSGPHKRPMGDPMQTSGAHWETPDSLIYASSA